MLFTIKTSKDVGVGWPMVYKLALKVILLVSMQPWHVCCISHRHCHQQILFFNLPWSE